MKKKVFVKYHNMFGQEPRGERMHQIEVESTGDINADLEVIFREMNHVDGTETQLIALKERSMSVGDYAIIDGRTFKCSGIGWVEIKPD